MKPIPPSRISLGIALLLMGLSARCVKATTTYTYSGNDFTFVNSPFTTSDSIQGNFTIATLADNLSFGSITPTSYDFTDGVETGNQTNSIVDEFEVSTNGGGQITEWDIEIGLDGGFITTDYAGSIIGGTDIGNNGDGGIGFVNNDPGTWTATSPEPSTFVLIPAGLVALALQVRRKKIQAHRPTPQLL
jgi:hypothetical protein